MLLIVFDIASPSFDWLLIAVEVVDDEDEFEFIFLFKRKKYIKKINKSLFLPFSVFLTIRIEMFEFN